MNTPRPAEAILDTDILSEYIKSRNPLVAFNVALYRQRHWQLTISSISVFEVVSGYVRADMQSARHAFVQRLAQFDIVELDTEAAVLAGDIEGRLKSLGMTIGPMDCLIAGMAIRHDRTLVTGNTAHFSRITELGFPLRLTNWRLPQ